MNIYEICFSPTGGTKKVADILIEPWSGTIISVDLTDSNTDFGNIALAADDIAVIAVPSFGGRVPLPAVERIAALKGNGAKAILVCVYGNRAYEDTLVELEDIVQQAGFKTISAVAAIAEHSINRQYAATRPDNQDKIVLQGFAKQIQQKLSIKNFTQPPIPGNRPYKERGGSGMIPQPTDSCTSCGKCAASCPVQAIDLDNPQQIDEQKCFSCMRCIYICPNAARKLNPDQFAAVNAMLKEICAERKDCELYL